MATSVIERRIKESYIALSSGDLNNITDNAVVSYSYSQYQNISHRPFDKGATVYVRRNGSTVCQVAMDRTYAGLEMVYIRQRVDNGWSPWKQMIPGACQPWGTAVSSTRTNGHFLVMINADYTVQVWFPSTNLIRVLVIVGSSGAIFSKEGTDSVTFGTTDSGTDVTMTRDGNTLTVTTASTKTITILNL